MLARNVILVELEFHDIPIKELLERQFFFFASIQNNFIKILNSVEIPRILYVRFIRHLYLYIMCFKLCREV